MCVVGTGVDGVGVVVVLIGVSTSLRDPAIINITAHEFE